MRPLPITPTPLPDEAFAGFLHRACALNGIDAARVARAVLYPADRSGQSLPWWFGWTLPERFVTPFADVLGVDPSTVIRLQVASALPDLSVAAIIGDDPPRRKGRVLPGTRICPWCFTDTGTVYRRWHLSAHPVCFRHRCLLTADCPAHTVSDTHPYRLPSRYPPAAGSHSCWATSPPNDPAFHCGGVNNSPHIWDAVTDLDATIDHLTSTGYWPGFYQLVVAAVASITGGPPGSPADLVTERIMERLDPDWHPGALDPVIRVYPRRFLNPHPANWAVRLPEIDLSRIVHATRSRTRINLRPAPDWVDVTTDL